jgi:hypothetical protein
MYSGMVALTVPFVFVIVLRIDHHHYGFIVVQHDHGGRRRDRYGHFSSRSRGWQRIDLHTVGNCSNQTALAFGVACCFLLRVLLEIVRRSFPRVPVVVLLGRGESSLSSSTTSTSSEIGSLQHDGCACWILLLLLHLYLLYLYLYKHKGQIDRY